jgi:tight adherence protein C
MQAAEEQAAKMSTKLLFPLILFMFPIFFIVAIGPAVLRIIDAFAQIGGR